MQRAKKSGTELRLEAIERRRADRAEARVQRLERKLESAYERIHFLGQTQEGRVGERSRQKLVEALEKYAHCYHGVPDCNCTAQARAALALAVKP